MKEKYNQTNLTEAEKEPEHLSDSTEMARHAILLSMDWDNLSDDEKIIAMPGLGYN
ncbi:MAG: hypothetical protein WCI37_02210 [bacterium]|jgi:hypothetical protein